MAANPNPFSTKSASTDQISFEANLTQHRLSLRQNHYRCEGIRAQLLDSLMPKLFGGKHRKQLLIMLGELVALGESLTSHLQETPRYFQGLDATIDRQVKDEMDRMTLLADAMAGIRVLTTPPTILHPSSGQLGAQSESSKHTYRQTIDSAMQTYNQKIRNIEDWRRKGTLRLIRMWLADIPTFDELPEALKLH